jgi:DinB superfamily
MAFGRPGVENGPMIDRRRDLLDRLRGVPNALAAAARAAPPEPTAPGEWTPSDVVRHLIAVEQLVWHARLVDLADTGHPTWPWTEPDRWTGVPGATLDELLSRYTAVRATTMATLDALDDAGWARTGTHATFGVLDVAGLMDRAIDHDEQHLRSFDASRP